MHEQTPCVTRHRVDRLPRSPFPAPLLVIRQQSFGGRCQQRRESVGPMCRCLLRDLRSSSQWRAALQPAEVGGDSTTPKIRTCRPGCCTVRQDWRLGLPASAARTLHGSAAGRVPSFQHRMSNQSSCVHTPRALPHEWRQKRAARRQQHRPGQRCRGGRRDGRSASPPGGRARRAATAGVTSWKPP